MRQRSARRPTHPHPSAPRHVLRRRELTPNYSAMFLKHLQSSHFRRSQHARQKCRSVQLNESCRVCCTYTHTHTHTHTHTSHFSYLLPSAACASAVVTGLPSLSVDSNSMRLRTSHFSASFALPPSVTTMTLSCLELMR